MTTADNPVFERVRATIAEILIVPVDQIGPETAQADLKNWDSMQQINIMLALEQSFGVHFAPEEFAELSSVAAIVGRIEETT